MHNFEIIGQFDPKSIVQLLAQCGMPAERTRLRGELECVKRTPNPFHAEQFYHVLLMDETLKFTGEVRGQPRSAEFILNWNNLSPIAPLIGFEDGTMLSFDVNIRRSLPFGTFAVIAKTYEQHFIKLME